MTRKSPRLKRSLCYQRSGHGCLIDGPGERASAIYDLVHQLFDLFFIGVTLLRHPMHLAKASEQWGCKTSRAASLHHLGRGSKIQSPSILTVALIVAYNRICKEGSSFANSRSGLLRVVKFRRRSTGVIRTNRLERGEVRRVRELRDEEGNTRYVDDSERRPWLELIGEGFLWALRAKCRVLPMLPATTRRRRPAVRPGPCPI